MIERPYNHGVDIAGMSVISIEMLLPVEVFALYCALMVVIILRFPNINSTSSLVSMRVTRPRASGYSTVSAKDHFPRDRPASSLRVT